MIERAAKFEMYNFWRKMVHRLIKGVTKGEMGDRGRERFEGLVEVVSEGEVGEGGGGGERVERYFTGVDSKLLWRICRDCTLN